MALQMETYLVGKINNIVYYKRKGQYIARSMPARVRQSVASKIASGYFGRASACGRSLRQQLQAALPFARDRQMQIRFSGAINKWMATAHGGDAPAAASLPFITGFSFNAHTSLAERWKVSPAVVAMADGSLVLQIPAFVPADCMAAPAHTVMVNCVVAVASTQLSNAASLGSQEISLRFSYCNELVAAQDIPLTVPTPAGALVITAMYLRFQANDGHYCSKAVFMPAGVVDARRV